MRDERPFTLVSPAPGFTARVMTRVVEHERARARRRALIGSALLVVFAGAGLTFVGIGLASWVMVLVTTPQVIVSVLAACGTLAYWMGKVLEALWLAASVIAENLDPAQMTMFAVAVFALTLIWVRVVTGSLQLSLAQTIVGGLRK